MQTVTLNPAHRAAVFIENNQNARFLAESLRQYADTLAATLARITPSGPTVDTLAAVETTAAELSALLPTFTAVATRALRNAPGSPAALKNELGAALEAIGGNGLTAATIEAARTCAARFLDTLPATGAQATPTGALLLCLEAFEDGDENSAHYRNHYGNATARYYAPQSLSATGAYA